MRQDNRILYIVIEETHDYSNGCDATRMVKFFDQSHGLDAYDFRKELEDLESLRVSGYMGKANFECYYHVEKIDIEINGVGVRQFGMKRC